MGMTLKSMKKIVSEDENNDVYQTFVDLFKKVLSLEFPSELFVLSSRGY